MLDNVESMLVDEDQSYSLGSDHNFIIINANIKKMPIKTPPAINKTNSNMQNWNIAKDTDWLLYQNCIEQVFSDWHDDSVNVDQLWADIKTWLIKAGQTSVGYKTYENGRHF